MSTFLTPPCGWSFDDNDAEREIRTIFYQHWSKMKNQMIESVNEINAWREKVVKQINKYADEQIRILAEDYDRQRMIFDQRQQESLETARVFWNAQNMQVLNELRNACQTLQIQVAQIQPSNGTISGIKVVTVQDQIKRVRKEPTDGPLPQKSTVLQSPQLSHNLMENDSLNLAPSNTNPSISLFERSQSSELTFSSNDHESIDKCPLCLMIFPLNMAQKERSQHVNEHYTD